MLKEMFEIRFSKGGTTTSLHALSVMELNTIIELLNNSDIKEYKVFNRRIGE